MRHLQLLRSLFFGAAALLAASSLRAESVDFTPRSHEVMADGAPVQGLRFVHGKSQVFYVPPSRWTWTGNASSLALRPPEGASSARAEITHRDGTSAVSWDTEGMNAMIRRARDLLPPLAQETEIADVRKDPLKIAGRETALFVFSGRLFAQNYLFSVVLLPMENEQFGFLLYAEKKEFEAAATVWMSSLYTLRWEKAAL